MTLGEYVEAAIRLSHRERCVLWGCYYGLVTESDACVYCGTSKQFGSRDGSLNRATGQPPSADAVDPSAPDSGTPSTRV